MRFKLLLLFFLFILSCRAYPADLCDQLIGNWEGDWKINTQIQSAVIYFFSQNKNIYSGYFVLQNNQRGDLKSLCNTNQLIFEPTAPLFNTCYGKLGNRTLSVWCLNPDQSGQFKKET